MQMSGSNVSSKLSEQFRNANEFLVLKMKEMGETEIVELLNSHL